jgi:hypothetical protein
MRIVPKACLTPLLLAGLLGSGCGRVGYDLLSGAEEDASFAQQDASFAQQDATFAQQDAAPLSLMDPPSLAGVWTVQTLTVDSGGPVDVPRATNGTGVVSNFKLVSTGPTTFDYQAGTSMIDNNLVVDYGLNDGTMTVLTDGKWLISTDSGDDIIVNPSLDAATLSLVWDESDPRNDTGTLPAIATVMQKNDNYTASSEGSWQSVSVEYSNGDVYTSTGCLQQSQTSWQRISMSWRTDGLNRFVNAVSDIQFSDAGCQNITQSDTELFTGMAEETGSQLLIWAEGESFGPLFFDVQLTFLQNQNPRLEVTSCSPTPGCNSLSTIMVFAPAP